MIEDKVAAAKKIDAFLKNVITSGAFKLKYRITVHPASAASEAEIAVELAGPDSDIVLERGAEMLRSLEFLCHEALDLHPEDYSRVSFDCRGYRAARQQELKLAAEVAAEKVLKSGVPFSFAPMSSRERRLVHLAFHDHESLVTQSEGEGGRRYVVLYPKDYKRTQPPRR